MRKRDVLSALVALTGGLLSLGEGPILAAPLVVVGGLLLGRETLAPNRKRLTAAVAALGR